MKLLGFLSFEATAEQNLFEANPWEMVIFSQKWFAFPIPRIFNYNKPL